MRLPLRLFEVVSDNLEEAVRTLKGLSVRDTCREAFKELKILTVASLYILETILYTTNTRHRHNFTLNIHHLSLFEKKPSYRGAVFYNCLPEELKKLPVRNLKTSLTQWLLDRPFYTLQEFLNWRT
ncbi:hypothetical protein J6590_031476 [Homalodisca vitripennis]|nr:hypothetical protein J6590_105686 [Homalodisca vitripennis]KAG8312013.1 hypothetical protein J6590_031476 [Homalodisca vitripennis]